MKNRKEVVAKLLARGFDKSALSGSAAVRLGCSQCEAVAINGVPCHEHGCPNIQPLCRECGNFGHRDCSLDHDPDEWEIDARMAEAAR